ncbi:MAG: hypothetical protein JST54_20960 [Deltaproteobacteria bacterium]|nr:hypothetical protein [Deltaproteobacteria bacterium]
MRAGFVAVVSTALLLGCSGSKTGNTTGGSNGTSGTTGGSTGSTGQAAVTSVGTPASGIPAVSKSIDASGGTLVSGDRQLTLTIPPGALSTPTTITISAIQNMAPGGTGYAYRMGPNGTTFAQPVTLTLAPTFGQLDGATASYDNVKLAFQDSQGRWQIVPGLTADTGAKTLTATTTHFTDYAYLLDLSIVASQTAMLTNGSVSLSVSQVPLVDDGSGNQYVASKVPATITGTPTWNLNGTPGNGDTGDGSLSPLANTCSYNAPSTLPTHDPETVSVSFTASDGSQVTLLSSLYVLAHAYSLHISLSDTSTCAAGGGGDYAYTATEQDTVPVDLDDSLNVTIGTAVAGSPPTVTGTACCVSNCTANFDSAAEPSGLDINGVTGVWDNTVNRLKIVPAGQAQDVPALQVTLAGQQQHTVNDGLSPWNTQGDALFFGGVSSIDSDTIPIVRPNLTGAIGGDLSVTQQ